MASRPGSPTGWRRHEGGSEEAAVRTDHVYFYGATAAPPETIQRYLTDAYELGKTFDTTATVTQT
jgi:hypothetical protein